MPPSSMVPQSCGSCIPSRVLCLPGFNFPSRVPLPHHGSTTHPQGSTLPHGSHILPMLPHSLCDSQIPMGFHRPSGSCPFVRLPRPLLRPAAAHRPPPPDGPGGSRHWHCCWATQLAPSSPPITVSAWLDSPPGGVNTPSLSRGPGVTAEPINLSRSVPHLITPCLGPLSTSAPVFIRGLMDGPRVLVSHTLPTLGRGGGGEGALLPQGE